jgi:hypothetical protein
MALSTHGAGAAVPAVGVGVVGGEAAPEPGQLVMKDELLNVAGS